MNSSLIVAAGLYDLAFAVFHLTFWRLFGWPSTLRASGELNSAITLTLNVVLTYVFVCAGAALIYSANADRDPWMLLAAGAGFWAIRAALQPMLFTRRAALSHVMTLIFIVGAALHAAPLLIED